jgi:hypothetical protein
VSGHRPSGGAPAPAWAGHVASIDDCVWQSLGFGPPAASPLRGSRYPETGCRPQRSRPAGPDARSTAASPGLDALGSRPAAGRRGWVHGSPAGSETAHCWRSGAAAGIAASGPSQSTDPAGHTSARPTPSRARRSIARPGWLHSTALRPRCARIPDSGVGASKRATAATPRAAGGAPPRTIDHTGRPEACRTYESLTISQRKKPVVNQLFLSSYT